MEFALILAGAAVVWKIFEEKPVVFPEESGRQRVPQRLYTDQAARSSIPPNEDFPFVAKYKEEAATNYLPKQGWVGMGNYQIQTRRDTGSDLWRENYK